MYLATLNFQIFYIKQDPYKICNCKYVNLDETPSFNLEPSLLYFALVRVKTNQTSLFSTCGFSHLNTKERPAIWGSTNQ